MPLSECRRLRVSIVTLGVLVIGAACADHAAAQVSKGGACTTLPASSCVQLTLNTNVQVTNLHPAVRWVAVSCAVKTGEPNVWVTIPSSRAVLTLNTFSGIVPVRYQIEKSVLASLNNKLDTVCELRLARILPSGAESELPAVASASQPQAQTDTNWNVVTTNSAIKWTRTVLFGAANP